MSDGENILTVALGLGFLTGAMSALVVIPLALVAHSQKVATKPASSEQAPAAENREAGRPWLTGLVFVAVFALIGVVGGALEPFFQTVASPTDNALNLTLGMSAFGAFAGLGWVQLENALRRRGGEWRQAIGSARRRLRRWPVGGFFCLGLLGMCVLGVPLLLFHNGMSLLGFHPEPLTTRDFLRIAGMGLLVGGGWGALLGLIAAAVASLRRQGPG